MRTLTSRRFWVCVLCTAAAVLSLFWAQGVPAQEGSAPKPLRVITVSF